MEKSQSVVIFSTAYFPLASGAELAIREVTDRIPDINFFLITARMGRAYPKQEHVGNVLVFRLGIGVPSFDKLLLPFLGAIRAHTLARKYRVRAFWSVMISYAGLAPILLMLLGLNRRMPLLITLQEGDSEEYIRSRHGGLVRAAWRLSLHFARHVHAISTYLGELARRYGYAGDITIVPNGVDVGKFKRTDEEKEGSDAATPLIVTTSRLVEKNGIDTLIRAFAELKKTYPRARLEIAGSGPLLGYLQRIASALGVEGAVIFLGALPYEDIPPFVRRASVFVRASRSEGLGTSFLEAMAAGVPIIATPVGGISDFLRDGETGLFTRVDDPDDLAAKISLLLSDAILRERLIRNAQRLVEEQYTWDSVAARMQGVLMHL